jgi:membrane protein
MINRIKNEQSFMGETHSISTIAIYLLLFALIPELFFRMNGTQSLYVIIISIFVLYGASRLPDLDNSKSSAMSALGTLGNAISDLLRAFSIFIYNITKTKYDSDQAVAHRGFFHTILSGVLFFFLVKYTTSIKKVIYISDNAYTIGTLVAIFWVFLCVHISLSSILKKKFDKNKKSGLIFINFFISLLISSILVSLVSKQVDNYDWIAFTLSFGHISHILEDSLTPSGVPLFFPLKRKGKRWYVYRIAKIKAGSEVEKKVVLPTFIIIAIMSIIRIIIYKF